MVVGGFERHEMEERWVCQRRWLAVNGNIDGIGGLLLVALAKVGGGPVVVKLGVGPVVVMD